MSEDRVDDARSAIDSWAGLPPEEIGTALRGVDAALRSAIAVAWFALALRTAAPPWAAALVGLALLSLVGVAPATVAVLGTALAAWIAAAAWSVAAATGLVLLGALRLRIHFGPAGRWLREVRHLEGRRAAALVATGFARARPDALAIAGDRYEQEGRHRAALAALGARPATALVSLCDAATRAGHALARWPGLLAALERAALRRMER